jgi:tetratricopeptide (TPR) repeat protein
VRPAALVGLLLLASCAGPPWYMGSPLDGKPSIPASGARRSVGDQRAAAATAQTKGQTVLELRALVALDTLERLTPANRARLVGLLEKRAAEFHALGRDVPESRDLERLARLAPARGAGLLGERASAERAAGDAWLAVGAFDEARAAYDRAIALGATEMEFRVRALWGHPPPETTSLAELRVAIATLPLRAVPPLAVAYVTRGGSDVPTLTRSLAGANQERMQGLAVRIGDALRVTSRPGAPHPEGEGAGGASDGGTADAAPGDVRDQGDASAEASDAGDAADTSSPPPVPVPAELDEWILRGPTVEGRLLPLVRAHPELLADVERALDWVELLLAEDETSPEVLELAAYVFGRASRFGGTERMLMELTYASPDRAAGLARGALVWERLGKRREACVQWIRAARWRDEPEDPTWLTAITCARREPDVASWKEIRAYVLARARPDRRAALAEVLDSAATESPRQKAP